MGGRDGGEVEEVFEEVGLVVLGEFPGVEGGGEGSEVFQGGMDGGRVLL